MAARSESPQQTRYFDILAAHYDRYAEITGDRYRSWLAGVIPDRIGQGSRAVDVGCGNGRFTGLLADRYDEVLAVDIAERQLEMARTKRDRPNIRYEHRDLRAVTPEGDGLFDLVLSVNTINHLRDHNDTLRRIRDLVAPGGHAVLVDIVYDDARSRHRLWQYQDALRHAARILVGRRSVSDALAVLKLRWHPTWIELVTTEIPLSRAQFHQRYREVFEGATFADDLLPIVCAIRWQAPMEHKMIRAVPHD